MQPLNGIKNAFYSLPWNYYLTRIVCIRPKGRTQCIFPRSQHSCLYVLTKSEFISSCSRPAVTSNIVQITCATFLVNVFFLKMAASSHFGCQKITLYRFSYHFRSMPQFLFLWIFFYKMAVGGQFECLKITFGRISGHFRSIRNFFLNFYKMAAGAHFGCLKFTFDRISGQYFLKFVFFVKLFYKMAASGHFGCPKNTFGRISGHFRSTQNFLFFYKMAAVGHFECPQITFERISGHFRLIRNFIFLIFLTKWPPADILDGTTMSSIKLVRDIWMSNAYVKFEERRLNPSKVIALTTKLWHGGGGPRRCGDCVADKNIIFSKTYVSREYNELFIEHCDNDSLPRWNVVHDFMNRSWTFMNVHEQFMKSS